LANDTAAQLKMLREANANGSTKIIDEAVIDVAEARRVKSSGIADL